MKSPNEMARPTRLLPTSIHLQFEAPCNQPVANAYGEEEDNYGGFRKALCAATIAKGALRMRELVSQASMIAGAQGTPSPAGKLGEQAEQ